MTADPTTDLTTDPAGFLHGFLTGLTEAARAPDADHGEVVDRYHTPDVVEVSDGITLDRDRLVAHLGPIRKNLGEYDVEVHEALAQGDRIAARFTIRAELRGRPTVTEVAFFGEFTADGRLRRAHQLTRIP